MLSLQFDDLSHKSSASSLSQTANTTSSPLNKTPTPSVEQNSPGQNLRRHTSPANFGINKSPRADQKRQDEWESKLFGNKGKNNLKPGSSESLNRKSWDSTKLASQIEEEEPLDSFEPQKLSEDNNNSVKTKISPEINKKLEKESMFSKLKNFRKGKFLFY